VRAERANTAERMGATEARSLRVRMSWGLVERGAKECCGFAEVEGRRGREKVLEAGGPTCVDTDDSSGRRSDRNPDYGRGKEFGFRLERGLPEETFGLEREFRGAAAQKCGHVGSSEGSGAGLGPEAGCGEDPEREEQAKVLHECLQGG